jgi:transcriptional regulator with XRE-family HTH domain
LLGWEDLDKIQEKFLENLQRRLNALDWNVPELSARSGISVPYLYKIMNGERWPSPPYLAKIAETLKIQVSVLFDEKKPVTAPDVRPLLERLSKVDPDDYTAVMEFLDVAIERRKPAKKANGGA